MRAARGWERREGEEREKRGLGEEGGGEETEGMRGGA